MDPASVMILMHVDIIVGQLDERGRRASWCAQFTILWLHSVILLYFSYSKLSISLQTAPENDFPKDSTVPEKKINVIKTPISKKLK